MGRLATELRRGTLLTIVAAILQTAAILPQALASPHAGSSVGSRPTNLAYSDVRGAAHNLLAPKDLPAVYLFIGTQCPVANGYTPRILALEKQFRAQGVHTIAVYTNGHEKLADIINHSNGRGYSFPVVKDNGMLAARLGATTTPEAIVLDQSGLIRYRGRIDDNREAAKVTAHDLKNAVAAIVAGRTVRIAETQPFGCVIMASSPAGSGRIAQVTYARDIAPLLQKNCQVCHRDGEVAPFALENYRHAAIWAKQIKDYTARRIMPPWKADSHGEFMNERRLTDKQIATIGAWVDAGAPEGNAKETPRAPKFKPGWQLGEPDAVISMPETFTLAAEGPDEYHCFVIPTRYNTDRWVSALEFHPGNRGVVHHIIAYIDLNGKARELDANDPGPGYKNPTPGNGPGFFPAGFFGGWAPGNDPRRLPLGVGNILPKGADIVLEVHYHRNGKPEIDQSSFGIYFSKEPIVKKLRLLPIVNPFFKIPAGESDYAVPASMPVPLDITILGVTPHMHMAGRSMKVFAKLPDKTEKPLVNVPDWDFNWQITYMYQKPLKLPKGSILNLEARYDNSTRNPKNPNKPPKPLTWGEQTTDEMCVAFVGYTADEEDLTKGKSVRDMFDFLQPDGGRARTADRGVNSAGR